MSSNLSVTKSTLAKLLASENLNVVHKNLPTAMFDLNSRTLYLPIWEDMSGVLYDLLAGHEVGHALFTPREGWHNATRDENGKFLGAFKDVLNVVEDARIEKLIKRRYPGLARCFSSAYRELYNRDFFGIKKLKDFSKLNIIDRINLYAKCGSCLIIPFSDEEREIVREVESAETWEDVCRISKALFELAKSQQDSQLNNLEDLTKELLKQFSEDEDMQDLSEDFEPSADDEEMGGSYSYDSGEEDKNDSGKESSEDSSNAPGEDSEEESEDESKEESGDCNEGEEETEDTKSEKTDSNGAGEDGSSNDPQSITDRKFREREAELVTESVEVYTYNLPKPEMDRIVVPNKLFIDNFYENLECNNVLAVKPVGEKSLMTVCVKKFQENNNRYINLLVKEFEMRKNASQYARTSVAKTGELDMSKLHKYRYTNDIFRKVSVVDKGKSHGMIMFVDMSGSMAGCFGPTLEQTLILVAFCRKVGIPFSVYGFSDESMYLHMLANNGKLEAKFTDQKFRKMGTDNYEIKDNSFHLRHFIDSKLSPTAYRRAFDALCYAAMNYRGALENRYVSLTDWNAIGFGLGGTPFIQTVMASRPLIEQFKIDNKVDITNVVYLTDGEGTGCFNFHDIKCNARVKNKVYMIDYKTKQRIEFTSGFHAYSGQEAQATALIEFVRNVTHCKHIGFYIAEGNAARQLAKNAVGGAGTPEAEQIDKFWRANEYYSVPHTGYDMYYFVKASTKNVEDEGYELKENMTNRRMVKVFSNAQNSKRKNRILVSRFAEEIAR